jgi:spermidine synthase
LPKSDFLFKAGFVRSSQTVMKVVRLPLLLLLFAASGVVASVYEIVWFQLLQLVIGSTAISLAILLGTFMGGMCIGSLAFPGLFKRTHPLRIYAVLEAGIGAMGLLVLFFLPYAGGLYRAIGNSGSLSILWRALLCAVSLVPPAVLMGATLPVVARLAEVTRDRMSRVGLLYAANIAGAVFGSLLAGFYLLRLYDVAKATYFAAVRQSSDCRQRLRYVADHGLSGFVARRPIGSSAGEHPV